MDEPIQVTRLPSGLTVVTERMERVETVSIGAYVATGSRNETADENGVSHFLEHMAFKGTETRSAAAIAEEVEAVGGHINAYTAREQTAYYVKMLKEDTALGVRHHRRHPDPLQRSSPKSWNASVASFCRRSARRTIRPDDIIFDHFQSTAFPDQALGRRSAGVRADGIRNDVARHRC